jgi:3-phosphoshikimate 1-carboxyvinyltransferase
VATRFAPARPLHGTLRPPPDKSISHRAALLAAMGEGRTRIVNYLEAADTHSTLAAVQTLGAKVGGTSGFRPGVELEIEGVGLRGARPAAEIDVGNAGTLLRLLPGWLAGQETGSWVLDGDESIRRRPVDRIAAPLTRMGARVSHREGGLPPLTVEGAPLRGVEHALPVPSAQVKSCLLLAGLLATGVTRVSEPAPTRDHTERMLAAAGAEVTREPGAVAVRPAERLEPGTIVVPGDLSSAAFLIAAALIVPGSRVALEGVGVNPTRTGFLRIARRMGAAIEVEAENAGSGEPVAILRAIHSELRGTMVGADDVALAIDELPLIALLGCFAEGETVITGAEELRRKESDRIATVAAALTALGGAVEAHPDGLVVRGGGGLRGGVVVAGGDHRIAMLGAVAGLASREGAQGEGVGAAAVSYPGFERDLAALAGG